MRFTSRTLGLLSFLLFLAAIWFWLRGNVEVENRNAARKPAVSSTGPGSVPASGVAATSSIPAAANSPTSTSSSASGSTAPGSRDGFPYRLRNTEKSIDELGLIDTAILLDNAFIDTAVEGPLAIPSHLRSAGDPGSYIVQARGPIDPSFYARLRNSGAEFVSYIPNNAALVRATEDQAAALAGSSRIQVVLKYEPYYKLEQTLLAPAVEQQPLGFDQVVNIQVFPRRREQALAGIRDLGGTIIAEDRTPFGPLLTVKPQVDSLAALAGLPDVARIEPAAPRVLLNDLTRVRLAVTADTITSTNYLNLTGSNVVVNVNDTGVDISNPDLAGRVSTTDTNAFTLLDFGGHGTHVAGTIASSGGVSATVTQSDGAPPDGSVAGANYRGKAPAAGVFVLPIDLQTGPLLSDAYLQETAAQQNYGSGARTNAMISNNSWGYGTFNYNSASASYDSAVRDALPGVTGSQPLLYVFAAGNSGFGTTNGFGGQVGTVLSPASAKNVISVGALENFRGFTNEFLAGYTDSDNEVASFSSRGNVGVGTEGTFGRFKPDVIAPGTFIVSTRSTNAFSDPSLDLGPYYRYESGTSMAAPAVSGTLALMQEFFEQKLKQGYSPALFKAMLINGARSVNSNYDLRVRKALNIQGWGLVNLTNSLAVPLTNLSEPSHWPVRFIDQSPTNVITTGQTHTWRVVLSPEARSLPLRATLVWTDPPGNPGAAIKLVNNLDLIITNLDTGEIFVGNNIPLGADFNAADTTNSVSNPDFVNNVENAFLDTPLGTNYSVSVIARRVNVNAVTANITDIVQDYALVLSSGNGELTDPFVSFTKEVGPGFTPPVVTITNGVPLLNQRVGANFQLVPGTNGTAAQWNFYSFTNVFLTNNPTGMTNGSNVAFVTFLPPNLSRPRNLDADIDLYVSLDSQLTNLNSAVVSNSFKSLHRGGTESVVFTNSPVGPDVVYYIGVKSEDQQASEFGIVALSTDLPFDSAGADGSRILRGYPSNVVIPDGSPESPGGALVFAIGVEPVVAANVTVENQITHESVGDLLGNLSHEDQFVVLNNHNRFPDIPGPVYLLNYDDSGSGQTFFSRHTDGPGSLNNFIGQTSSGVWLLTMTDDSIGRTGVVNSLTITIAPQPGSTGSGIDLTNSVFANQWNYYLINVPSDASRLTVFLSQMSGPLSVYLRRDDVPTTTIYDKSALIDPPGGSLSLGVGDVPPLNPGRYFIGVFNPTASVVNYHISTVFGFALNSANKGRIVSIDTPLTILDDAVTTSSLFAPSARPIVSVRAGVRIEHPRASDLVLHLVSPQGSRTLLSENRGGDSADGYGATLTTTNVFPKTSRGGPNEDRNVIDTGYTGGTVRLDYDFFTAKDSLRVYYEGILLFDTGLTNGTGSVRVNFGPGTSTDVTIVVNEGGSLQAGTAWVYTASVVDERIIYTTFTDSTNLAEIPIKFAEPPFTNSLVSAFQTNRVIVDNGFEGVTNGVYAAGSSLSEWLVTGGGAVVQTTGNPLGVPPFSGTNFVQLDSGGNPSGVLTNFATQVNGLYRLEFAHRRNPLTPSGETNVLAIYANGSLFRTLNVPLNQWTTSTIDFRTLTDATSLEIRSVSTNGALIDAVMITEQTSSGNSYFLPEEPLHVFEGEVAIGTWTLEVWDNRAGPLSAEIPRLLSWELDFTYASTNVPLTLLTNCVEGSRVFSVYETNSCIPTTNVVAGNEMKYFAVNVPRRATMATNILQGTGDLVLWYNETGLPGRGSPGDVRVNNFLVAGGEYLLLDTNTPPLLKPGQRYYLGVANLNTGETNTFTLSVEFDQIDTNLVNPTTLTNAVPYSDTIPVTNAIDYYQFVVSSNATGVRFDLTMVGGDVDLVVRKAVPGPTPLPRPNPGSYDYISRNSGTQPENITVTTNSQPMPLAPGVWYLGVYNVGLTPANYTVIATEFTNGTLNIIPLVDSVPVNFFLASGSGLTNFFQFTITQSNSAALFEVYNLNDAANLLLDLGIPPDPAVPFVVDAGTPIRPAQIVLRTNASFPSLNGDWYLAVDNVNNANLSFTIRAVASTNGVLPSGLPLVVTVTPSGSPPIGFDLNWYSVFGEKYLVESTSDFVTWSLVDTVYASDVFVTVFVPLDPAQPILFYRVRQVPP